VIVGIGVDVIEIQRLRDVLARQGDRFIRRVFTPTEQEYCQSQRDSIPHYAARFAAKEAAFKALGTGWAKGVRWLDVEVRRKAGGAPELMLSGEAKRLSEALGGSKLHVSLSHAVHSAIAMVVIEG